MTNNYPQGNMHANTKGELLWYSLPSFDAYAPKLMHGFSSRLGGVSRGSAASLNLGLRVGDNEDTVRENFRLFGEALQFDPHNLVFTQQTHSAKIRVATREDAGKGFDRERDYHDVDGLITKETNLPLLANHADCAAAYYYEPQAGLIGLAHVGWRGTAHQIARVMVEQMVAMGGKAKNLLVGIGPCAGPCCYEIGPEVAELFDGMEGAQGPACTPIADSNKFLLDMPGANQQILIKAGVLPQNITVSGLCTVCNNDIFYSHRKQSLFRGAMASVIMLRP